MRILPLLLLLIFLQVGKLTAQVNTPPIYQIKSDTAFRWDLDNRYWQILKDPEGKWDIDQVQEPPLSNQFKNITKSGDLASFPKTNWIRFSLKNATGKMIKFSLEAESEKNEVYIPDTNKILRHYTTGYLIPWEKKDGFRKNNSIPFEMKPGEEMVIYLKTFNRRFPFSDKVTMTLFNTDKLERSMFKDYEENYIESSGFYYTLFSGMFVLAAIFNFLIYVAVKEKVYLYFSLMLFFIAAWYAHPLSEILHNYPVVTDLLSNMAILWIIFLLFFTRHYFNVFRYYPRWDKMLLFMSGFIFLDVALGEFADLSGHFIDFFYNSVALFIGRAVLILFLLSMLITIGIFLLKPGRERKVFIIGILPFVICFVTILIYLIFFHSAITDFGFFDFLLGICIVWAIIVFSMFLFKRYALQEKQITQEKLEKEQLAREKEIQKRELIQQQKIELEKQVAERTSDLKHSLEELKSTQSQLIQSEKMASLGELTAGIAHEIQNPLNFVNNFSDVNKELLAELKDEIEKGNTDEVKALANDVIENEEKINHHGKRADAIVKGMLQHSRKSTGQKEPTDINALADEYLRLSYHGLRAKDKTFNATMKTDFDETIGKVNVIPQDIGRVLLNLFNNAFYAASLPSRGGLKEQEPTVWVSTKKLDARPDDPVGRGNAQIKVCDNGPGIPQNIIDKIFQPFFTTKPTGEGTGLGLSLSYDIIKAHGGVLKVKTKEGEGTEFIIELPVK